MLTVLVAFLQQTVQPPAVVLLQTTVTFTAGNPKVLREISETSVGSEARKNFKETN